MQDLHDGKHANNNAYHRWADQHGVSKDEQAKADKAWEDHAKVNGVTVRIVPSVPRPEFTTKEAEAMLELRAKWAKTDKEVR